MKKAVKEVKLTLELGIILLEKGVFYDFIWLCDENLSLTQEILERRFLKVVKEHSVLRKKWVFGDPEICKSTTDLTELLKSITRIKRIIDL